MIAILTNYWLQTVAIVVAFGLLGVKMVCKAEDATVDAVVWILLAFAGITSTTKAVQASKKGSWKGGANDATPTT
jgi:hypothetical protein